MLGPDDDCSMWLAGSSSISSVIKVRKNERLEGQIEMEVSLLSLLSSLFHYLVKSNAKLNSVWPVDSKLVNNDISYEKLKVNHCIQI